MQLISLAAENMTVYKLKCNFHQFTIIMDTIAYPVARSLTHA